VGPHECQVSEEKCSGSLKARRFEQEQVDDEEENPAAEELQLYM